MFIVLPLAGGWYLIGPALTSEVGWVFLAASLSGAVTYLYWYLSMNMTGVSRAMALNITYSCGNSVQRYFTEVEITSSLLFGAAVITIGMVMVVGNPKEMINLRNVA